MNQTITRRLGIALAAGGLGFGLNALPQAALTPFAVGRIVTLPIAILYGPWYGVLSALILPVLLLSAVSSQLLASKQESEGTARLDETARVLRDQVEQYVNAHTQAIRALALALTEVQDDRAKQRELLVRSRPLFPGL